MKLSPGQLVAFRGMSNNAWNNRGGAPWIGLVCAENPNTEVVGTVLFPFICGKFTSRPCYVPERQILGLSLEHLFSEKEIHAAKWEALELSFQGFPR